MKVTEKEGREGDEAGMEKHDTEEVTSPFTGEFYEVSKLGEREGWGGREGGHKQAFRILFYLFILRKNSSGVALLLFSPRFACSASTPRTSWPTEQRSGQMLLTFSSMAECIIRLMFT